MGMLRIALVLALSGIISFVAIPDAFACMNAMRRDLDVPLKSRLDVDMIEAASKAQIERNKRSRDFRMRATNGVWKIDEAAVEKATDALNDGRNADVITGLYGHFGLEINSWALNAKHVTDREREVVLLVALAVLRTEGAIERHQSGVKSKPARKVDNVRWAIRAMEGLAFVQFAPERHIVEAWGRDPELKELATKKLLQLNHEGKLQSPFQFDLLARLLREQGETAAAEKIEVAKREVM